MNFNCLLRGKVWSGSTLFLDARIQFEDTRKQSETRRALCPTTNEERQNAIELTLRKLRMQQSLLESHHVLSSPLATRVRGWYKYTVSNSRSHRNPRNVSTFNSSDKSSLVDRTSTSTFYDWCHLKSQQLQEHLPCQRDLGGRRMPPWWLPQKPPRRIPSGLLCPRMSASFTEWIPFPEWIHRWGNVEVFRAVTVPGVAFVFLTHFIMNFSGLACCLLQIRWRSPLWYRLGSRGFFVQPHLCPTLGCWSKSLQGPAWNPKANPSAPSLCLSVGLLLLLGGAFLVSLFKSFT